MDKATKMDLVMSLVKALEPQRGYSSLPFKKSYPTLRDHPLHTAEVWLEGKRADDGADGLWRIHDKLYDFTKFVELHPGGSDWLRLTKGTDITEAFECHHISLRPEQKLPNFYVKDAKHKRNAPFTFEDNGFYRTLKRNLTDTIVNLPEGPKIRSKIMTDSLFVSYIVCATLSAYFRSFSLGILAGLLLSMTAIAAHNFFHQMDNFRMYYFDFIFMSSRSWRVTHALSHHLYTNTIYDYEIAFAEPFFQYLPVKKHFVWRYGSWIYAPIIYIASLPVAYLRMIIQAFTDGGKSYECTSLLPFSVLLVMYTVSTENILMVIIRFSVIVMAAGFHFGLVGLNAAHHAPEIFHDGDAPRSVNGIDWGIHEIDAVTDRSDINWSHFLILTNFGEHCLHHLFPTVDHGNLKYLQPIFQKTCEQFGIKSKLTTQLKLMKGQYLQLARTEPQNQPPVS